jgi:ABC-type amino acid transport system permease subunit
VRPAYKKGVCKVTVFRKTADQKSADYYTDHSKVKMLFTRIIIIIIIIIMIIIITHNIKQNIIQWGITVYYIHVQCISA